MAIWFEDTKQWGVRSDHYSLKFWVWKEKTVIAVLLSCESSTLHRDLQSSSSSCFITTSRAPCSPSSVMFFHLCGLAVRRSHFIHLFLSLFCICRIPVAVRASLWCFYLLPVLTVLFCILILPQMLFPSGRVPALMDHLLPDWWKTLSHTQTHTPFTVIFSEILRSCWNNLSNPYFTNAFSRTLFLPSVLCPAQWILSKWTCKILWLSLGALTTTKKLQFVA